MKLAKSSLIVALVLAALTLWYTGQWAGKNPRPDARPLAQATVQNG